MPQKYPLLDPKLAQAGSMIKKGHVRQFDAWYLGSVPSDGSPTEEKATASFRLIKARLQDRISAARKASSAQDNRRNATRNRRSSTMLRGPSSGATPSNWLHLSGGPCLRKV